MQAFRLISPIVPGHEVTGRVAELGAGVTDFTIGDPVGVQPLWWTCEECEFCTSGREHLCHERKITGEHVGRRLWGVHALLRGAHVPRPGEP
jgi:D-arabinose 1-dehydrogenase-like Zn-dependent alcohol dehydrogenase